MTPGRPQVFADPRGRRRTILLPLAFGAGCLLCGFVLVVTVGFLGGPEVPLLHVPQAQPRATSHNGRSSHQAAAPARPAVSPSPTPAASALTGQPQATSSPSAAAAGPSTAPANRAGKTPPGRFRAASPSPRGTRP
jgi:predicted lipid-binding transport protein (Tim44 family)